MKKQIDNNVILREAKDLDEKNKSVILSEAKDLNNKEYIAHLFENDNIRAPESLSEDNVLKMLDAAGAQSSSDLRDATDVVSANNSTGSASTKHSKPEASGKKEFRSAAPRKKSRVVRWVALAACAVLAVVIVPQFYHSALLAPNTASNADELYTFGSYTEIERTVKKINKESPLDSFRMKSSAPETAYEESADFTADSDAMLSAEGSAGAQKNMTAGSAAGANHSETYLQVEDVDEADIVKVDGKYIYCVTNKSEVVILEAEAGKTKKVAAIGSQGIENYINDIFLKGDTLVTIGKVYDDKDEGYSAVVSYDISDRSKPVLISEFRQSGNIISSRMVGDFVYVISEAYTYGSGSVIPKCTVDGELSNIPYRDISCVPNPNSSSYIILSAVDIASGKAGSSKTKAVLGATNDIYCNDHNLYAAVTEWSNRGDAEYTRIVRAALDGLKIRFNGSVSVRGSIDNQFSMDEKDGYFRIATTSMRAGINVNNLFVLDEKLKETGSITGFARNESIKAVRFIGDKAYVITYEAIDPLFVIDLSDPAAPHIEGEVKIDGFSTLLVPVDRDKLIGIGHATGDNGYGGEYASGLKLALFDISDPSEPKVLDSKEFKDMSSPAQSTHLALTVNSKEEYFAIPYDIYSYDDMIIEDAETADDTGIIEDAETDDSLDVYMPYQEPKSEHGVLVFGTEKEAIDVYDCHKLGDSPLLRSVYIDDFIYALDASGHSESFRFEK